MSVLSPVSCHDLAVSSRATPASFFASFISRTKFLSTGNRAYVMWGTQFFFAVKVLEARGGARHTTRPDGRVAMDGRSEAFRFVFPSSSSRFPVSLRKIHALRHEMGDLHGWRAAPSPSYCVFDRQHPGFGALSSCPPCLLSHQLYSTTQYCSTREGAEFCPVEEQERKCTCPPRGSPFQNERPFFPKREYRPVLFPASSPYCVRQLLTALCSTKYFVGSCECFVVVVLTITPC